MTSQHRTDRFRVEAPTLEPDPVFLDMLAGLGASSRSAGPRTARPAGLRMIVATASVAVIAAATWAGGNGMGTPLSPADSPSQQEPSGPPSHGDVATPQRDVSISPGSPVSPGLPGTPPALPDQADGGGNDGRNGRTGDQAAPGTQGNRTADKHGKSTHKAKTKTKDNLRQAKHHEPDPRK